MNANHTQGIILRSLQASETEPGAVDSSSVEGDIVDHEIPSPNLPTRNRISGIGTV